MMGLIPAAAAAVRLVGLKGVSTRLERMRDVPPPDVPAVVRVGRDALSRAAHRGFYPGNCLSRSLALAWWLRRRGIVTELKLGTEILEGRLQAHAWLELQGEALTPQGDYVEAFSLAGLQG